LIDARRGAADSDGEMMEFMTKSAIPHQVCSCLVLLNCMTHEVTLPVMLPISGHYNQSGPC
jgi:hypothetical protein